MVVKKKSVSAATIAETWNASKKDAKNNVRMPPLIERMGKKEPRSLNTEAEDEEEEELGSTGHTSHFSESHQSGLV